jgi:CheY-like chemotaxis protein
VQRFAYEPLDPEAAEQEGVDRLARELRHPVERLRHVLQEVAYDPEAGEVRLREIHENLLAISLLVRELSVVVIGAAHRPRSARSSVLCGASVLIVGEDPERLHAMSEILREERVALVTATSAPECLVRVTAQPPDVVIADHAVGVALASTLVTVAPRLPMIVTSAGDNEAVFANTNAYVLDPPHTRVALLGLLETVLLAPHARMR